MKEKAFKRVGLVSAIVVVALVLGLVAVTFLTSAQPPKAYADVSTLYMAEYHGDNGTLPDAPDGHYSKEFVAAKYGVDVSKVLSIDSGLKLYDYLAGNNYGNYQVGILEQDVALSYNIHKDGYDVVAVNSSDAIFDKVLDGNGWTVKIHGGAGVANSTKEALDDDTKDGNSDYRNDRRHGLGRYGNTDIWYEYTGYLVAQNYGTIANLTIDYTSGHTVIEAIWGSTGNNNGDLGQVFDKITTRLISQRQGSFVAGIIAGLNGYDGNIDNVRLNIQNSFTAIKRASNNSGYFYENTSYVGGIAGRIEENSTISNCWVDIASSAGVFAGTQGKPTNNGSLDKHFSMAVAGGIVGNIDKGTAKLTYCALTGSGQVKAFANRASQGNRFMAYAGGAVGGCILHNGGDSIHDVNDEYSVEAGQILGIISSWTGSRFTNFHNDPKTSMGTLFDALGSDDEIKSIALLFNLQTLMDNNPGTHKPVDKEEGKIVLDSSGNLRSWLEIFPTSDGGSMSAKFDTQNKNFDIRVHIIADGHDAFKNSGALDEVDMTSSRQFYQYKMSYGDGGGFIWSGIFESANDSSNHINLELDDPIYAEVFMISSKNSGKYNYQFGTIVDLLYSDTNGTNGNLVREYTGTADPLKLPDVVVVNNGTNIAVDTGVFKNEELWLISHGNSSDVKLADTYMPGTYYMKVERELGERVYGYYNEDMRLIAWQPNTDYVFTILPGELKFGNGTTNTDGWQDEVTFELNMNGAKDFDYVEFQRNGVFPSDSSKGFDYKNGNAYYTVKEGTGKNGTAYTFYAYKKDVNSGENVLVAISASRTVRIDTEDPEVSEIEYYIVEDGEERLLSEYELDALQGDTWTKNKIIAKFTVTDNGKSGIAIAANESCIIVDDELNSNGDRYVEVEITDSKVKELVYIDGRGNKTVAPIKQLNVDRIQGTLSFSSSNYIPEGRFNYSTKSVVLRYVANFGSSGWKLWYSYQRDENGEDIWIETDELLTDSGALKQFEINWNMGSIYTGADGELKIEGDDFKIKMTNVAGLYEEEVFPIDSQGNPNPVVGNYVIWLRIANIYLDYSLTNIFVEGEDRSVAEIVESGESAKYFDKEYDGTDEYNKYKFYANLSDLAISGFVPNDKLGVIYSPSSGISRPTINLGNNGKVPVVMKYSSSDVGNVSLSFQVVLTGVEGYNYEIYFTKLSSIDFDNDVEVEEGNYSSTCEIDVKIKLRRVEIELSEQDVFKKVYYYGDEIPSTIQVYVEATGEYVDIELETQASSTAKAGITYSVEGVEPDGHNNVRYEVNPTEITINQRKVHVNLSYDGGEVGNIPTGVTSGKTHYITGTYEDVNGKSYEAIITYYLVDDNNENILVKENTLSKVGKYKIVIKIEDDNYILDGQDYFMFRIAKGFLNIETGARVNEYTQDVIEYDPIIDEESRELFEDSDIKITYFKYLNGAKYNPVTKKIEGNYDKFSPLDCAPTEIGLYAVKVEFTNNNQPNFYYKSDYEEGYLIIEKSNTQVNVEKITLEYSFTAEKFTFDLIDAVTEVRSSNNIQLWASGASADGIIKVQYKNAKGSFVDVDKDPKDGGGWYSETGRYEYRVTYAGDDKYKTSSIDVVMVINEAKLEGITFASVKDVVYDGKSHVPTPSGLNKYTELKVTYQYGTTIVDDVTKLNIVNANDTPYTIYMKVQKSGYQTLEILATVTIKRAKMEGVSATLVEADYDGQRHYVNFKGLTSDASGNLYYKNTPVTFASNSNSEGNTFATNVKIGEDGRPSHYEGIVILSASNYENLEIHTYIKINQVVASYKEIGKDLPSKIPSAMALSDYKGYYIDKDGNKVECALQFKDAKGNIVELDKNGTLADGKYSVMLVLPDSNYYIDRYWKFEIGEINSAQISALGFVAIGAVSALMVAAIITAIVVVKKRKQAGIV